MFMTPEEIIARYGTKPISRLNFAELVRRESFDFRNPTSGDGIPIADQILADTSWDLAFVTTAAIDEMEAGFCRSKQPCPEFEAYCGDALRVIGHALPYWDRMLGDVFPGKTYLKPPYRRIG